MKRKFEEKREITESISRTVCDICGEVVVDNKPFITLYASDSYHPIGQDETLEVCTPACLEKNIKGIRCVLDGKMVPSADGGGGRKKDDECYEKAEVPMMKSKIVVPLYIGK